MEKMISDSEMSTELKKQSNIDNAEKSLTVQWKYLYDHFDSFRSSLLTRLQNLHDREKELEAKETNFKLEMESKANALHEIEQLIAEKRQQVEKGETHLHSLKSLIDEHNQEIEVKGKRLEEVIELVWEKERDYDFVQVRFEEGIVKLNWVEKTVDEKSIELESKEKKVKEVEQMLDKCSEYLELKERQLNLIMGSIQEHKTEYGLKEDQMKEWEKEMKLKKEKLSLIQKSIEECSSTLSSKEKVIREMDLKVKDFCLHRKSMEEWSCKLELKERELEQWVEKLESKEKQFESKVEELHLIHKRVNECLNEVQLKERRFDSLEKLLQEREKHLVQQAKELESQQKQFDSIRKSTNILDSGMRIEQLEYIPPANNVTVPPSSSDQSDPNVQLTATADAGNFQGFLNENSSGNYLIHNKSLASDPAKLVLDLMQTSFSEYWKKGDVGSKAALMSGYISLLDKLMRLSPCVEPGVKKDAMKIAIQWKQGMGANSENSLELLGFLHFVSTYGLLSAFDVDEIVVLLRRLYQNKEALKLCQTLGFADKIPYFIQNLTERKQVIEAVRLIFTFKLLDKFPPVPLLEAYVADLNKFSREMRMQKKSLEEKDMAVDYQIGVLRAVIQCIKDYKLESEYPSRDIETQIGRLEKLKENWRLVSPSIASNVERQEQEKGKKRSTSTFNPLEFQPQQQPKNICHRAAVSDAGPHPLLTFTPVYLQARSLYVSGQTGQFAENHGHREQFAENHGHCGQVAENHGHPGHFGMAAIGANLGATQNAGVHNPDQYLPTHCHNGPN